MTKILKFAHNKYEVIIMNLFYLCLKIFSARIIDVSMNTIRTVYIVKGKRLISTVIAFFEVLIWFEVARTALYTEINSFLIPISYAGGYATGTYIGTLISTKFIKGHYTVTIISNNIDSTKIKNFWNIKNPLHEYSQSGFFLCMYEQLEIGKVCCTSL